ncbi:MAG: FHA domain-containing protein, partial [Solirubrobacterales bacterium]
MQEHGESTVEFEVSTEPTPPSWLETARAELPKPGRYLLYHDDDDEKLRIFPLQGGWNRIGRSVAADIQLDHPSVSRR